MKKKSRQHPDFPGGHPPEYYPSLRLLNFTERTGYGVLSLRWPSTKERAMKSDILLSTNIDLKLDLRAKLTSLFPVASSPKVGCRLTPDDRSKKEKKEFQISLNPQC